MPLLLLLSGLSDDCVRVEGQGVRLASGRKEEFGEGKEITGPSGHDCGQSQNPGS